MELNDKSINYFDQNFEKAKNELVDFLKIPSVSTDPSHVDDINRAASYLVKKLEFLGFTYVNAYPTQRHPIVYGELMSAGEDSPTLLIYGHYDVQPPDPLNEWNSDPFNPTFTGDYLIARGSSDMKGQIMATIIALESVLNSASLNLNIKFVIEGEEEIGSPSLDDFLESHKKMLKADMVLNTDAGMISADKPTLVYGLRGLAYFELRVFGPSHDLHSGLFGGAIANPALVLSKLLTGLHNEQGRVTLPGFYDRVRQLTAADRKRISDLKIEDSHYLELTGVPKLFGESGYSVLERIGARPTLDVNGMYSGFIGDGSKTIIPAYAKAKISCRLVPEQDPEEVFESMEKYCQQYMPDTVTYELIKMSGAPAYLADNAPGMKNLVKAFEDVWQTKVAYKREGGSVPVATSMKKILGVDSLLTGFGLPDDLIHSPNERLHLPTWIKGIQSLILFLQSFNK